MVKLILLKEGLIVGNSSGSALATLIKLSEQIDSGNIRIILPDSRDRYFSKKKKYIYYIAKQK